jgi:hypothetical protein
MGNDWFGTPPAWEQVHSFIPWNGGDYRPIAVLTLEPDELSMRLGIIFFDEGDDLDHFEWAGLKLATGEQLLLVRHHHSPSPGTQVNADLGSDTTMVLNRFLDATGMTMAQVSWRAPSRSES